MLKLVEYSSEAGVLIEALLRSRRKIFVFIATLMTIVVIFGALMYVVEGPEHGFTSIPTSMYWAIVTMATVGFGDIAPQTTAGRAITSVLILIGYSIIAVPTGIYTAELAKDYQFTTTFWSEADIRLPETVVYALPAGHYFLRVRATNASGYTQDAFDYYVMETGKAYGMKSFFVEADGSVTEDLYEE